MTKKAMTGTMGHEKKASTTPYPGHFQKILRALVDLHVTILIQSVIWVMTSMEFTRLQCPILYVNIVRLW